MENPDHKLESAAVAATELVSKVAHVAESLTKSADERVTQSLVDAIKEVFGEHKKSGRFVDVSRIPLICNNITEIHGDIKEMKGMFKEMKDEYADKQQFLLVQKIVFGAIGFILITVLGAGLALIIIK